MNLIFINRDRQSVEFDPHRSVEEVCDTALKQLSRENWHEYNIDNQNGAATPLDALMATRGWFGVISVHGYRWLSEHEPTLLDWPEVQRSFSRYLQRPEIWHDDSCASCSLFVTGAQSWWTDPSTLQARDQLDNIANHLVTHP